MTLVWVEGVGDCSGVYRRGGWYYRHGWGLKYLIGGDRCYLSHSCTRWRLQDSSGTLQYWVYSTDSRPPAAGWAEERGGPAPNIVVDITRISLRRPRAEPHSIVVSGTAGICTGRFNILETDSAGKLVYGQPAGQNGGCTILHSGNKWRIQVPNGDGDKFYWVFSNAAWPPASGWRSDNNDYEPDLEVYYLY